MITESIALDKLAAWKGNVRKTGVTDDLAELKSSILAHGLLNPLTIQKGDKGERRVIAGQRRLLALRALQKEGKLAKEYAVPCVVLDKDADATEISLAENAVRSAMHPADQFEAFRDLIDKRSSIGDVATRFGVSDTTVTKLLKLGRVSPKLLDVYRKGDMNLEQVQALALSDDHAMQEQVWKDAKGWQRDPRELRSALTKGEISASDTRVQFIGGLAVYEAAGGKVRRDLFDGENAGYVSDMILLNQLVTGRLEYAAAEVRAEGWKWVEVMPEFQWTAIRGFETVRQYPVMLSPEQEKRLAELGEQHDKLTATAEEEGLTDEQETELEAIQEEIDELQSAQVIYRSEDIEKAGAFVSIGYRGETQVRRGYVKPEDQDNSQDEPKQAASAEPKVASESGGLPASLIEDLTAQRTAAMRQELASNHMVALAATLHALGIGHFYIGESYRHASCLQLSARITPLEPRIQHPADCLALDTSSEDSGWQSKLPDSAGDFWQWCVQQPITTLLSLLAFLVSRSVDAVAPKGGKPRPHADQLAATLGLDMSKYFGPTAENYLSRLPKPELTKAIAEITGEAVSPATEKMKKGALAELAEKSFEASDCMWLPGPLRTKAAAADDAELEDELEQAA